MPAILVLAIIIAALVLFDVLAVRFGVDSRPDFGDPRAPADPVGIEA